MRIQHNILAMNAYRNYTSNTNALGKNLEKLSSGYKINRAGDDAAGLAISEKMRAQITGLNAAQKNVKDGISLVKTAEGALSEVHDMLNRMTYLATQSANGTYDNETDRYQLQKEVEQLKAEINRIADSSNFNGIKLLDGSMDTTAITGVTYDAVSDTKLQSMFIRGDKDWNNDENWDATNQQHVDKLNKNRLETEGGKSSRAGFQISLDGIGTVKLEAGATFALQIGGSTGLTLKFKSEKGGTYTASQLANELAKQVNKSVKDGGSGGSVWFDGHEYTVKADGKVLTFTAHDNEEDNEFKLNTSAEVTWAVNGKVGNVDASSAKASIINATNNTPAPAAAGKAPKTNVNKGAAAGGFTESTDNDTKTVTITGVDSFQANGTTSSIKNLTITVDNQRIDLSGLASTYADKSALIGAITRAIQTQLGAITRASGAPGAEYKDINVNFSGSTASVTFTKTTWTQNTGTDTPTKAEIDFSGLTGKDLLGGTITIAGEKFQFITEKETAKSGYEGVVIKANSTASDVAVALATAMQTRLAQGANAVASSVTAVGGKVTITSKGVGDAAPAWTISTTPGTGSSDDVTSVTLKEVKGLADATAAGNLLTNLMKNGDITHLASIADAFKNAEVTFNAGGKEFTVKLGDAFAALKNAETATAAKEALGKALASAIQKGLGSKYQVDTVYLGATEGETEIYNRTKDGAPAKAADGDVTGISFTYSPASESKGIYGGTINTGLQNVTDNIKGDTAGLANTTIDLGADKVRAWQDGAQIRLGDETYTVALGKESKFKNVKNVIDLTDLTDKEIASAGFLARVAAQRLTVAAKDNKIFTVGHDGSGHTTLQQRTEVKETTDMSTKEKLLSYIGVSIADADSIENAKAGEALTLQIGDTSDSYNQLKVSIGDAHTAALGIDKIDISTQEGAADAVAKVKAAINQVSDIRGTLGATQNRLEHTQNNLSVMAENIQDAESTIRDTDVAEEMMQYVKNNILIQSAQAMLAQANQIPQGVLQLLG